MTLTAAAVSDEACDAQSGHLAFSVAASPALSEAQYGGAAVVLVSAATGEEVGDCTSAAGDFGFEVDCTGLPEGAYELAMSVPNTQNPGAAALPCALSGAPACLGPTRLGRPLC